MLTKRLVIAASFLLAGPTLAQAQASGRSVLEGVYSEAQAKRGQVEFEANCSTCHRAEWFGGPEFKEHWGWGEIFWVYDFARKNMPYDQPGTLPRQSYLDVVAYILKLNGYPEGPSDLPSSDDALMGIQFPTPSR
jgi:mono/diheme cytochrome c family protein